MGAAGRRDPVTGVVVGRGSPFPAVCLAWVSHFFVEHSRPASFGHPLWSWWADQKMVALMLSGKNEPGSSPLYHTGKRIRAAQRNLTPAPVPCRAASLPALS